MKDLVCPGSSTRFGIVKPASTSGIDVFWRETETPPVVKFVETGNGEPGIVSGT